MKATAKNSSQQILYWFAQQKKPCSTAQVHAAIAPNETLRRFRGRISSLITAGKLVRKTVGKGKTTMVLAKDGLVDRRSPVARPLGAPPAPRYADQVAPFDETIGIDAPLNRRSLDIVVDRQIADLYGQRLAGVPAMFVTDDHD